jgi:prevent-host-death family protein
MERTVDAVEAQRDSGELLREVETRGGPVVVERDGAPIAAVVPIELYRRWKRQHTAFFEQMREAAERSHVGSEGETMELAMEAQRWARSRE